MKISQFFTLEEMILSQTAIRKSIDNIPTEEVIKNLELLCKNVLDNIRVKLSTPIHVSSGYRSPALNKAIGGAKTSQHVKGQAADISIHGVTTENLYNVIKGMGIEYDQLIQEFDSWVHISFNSAGNRKENLRAIKSNGKTVYLKD